MRQFSFRPITSVQLSYDITSSIAKCNNDSLGMKLAYLLNFNEFAIILMFPLDMQII